MNCTARSHSFRIWKEWLLSSAQPLPSHIHLHAQNMECLQWVGSFKLQVSFAEYRLFYRVLLQKETYNWKEPCQRTTTALTHPSACHIHLHSLNMERLQLVRSLKLEVSSAEYRLFHRVLLKKRPIINNHKSCRRFGELLTLHVRWCVSLQMCPLMICTICR